MGHGPYVKWYCWNTTEGWIWYNRHKTNAAQWVWRRCLQSNLVQLKSSNCTFSEKGVDNDSPIVNNNSQAVYQMSSMLKYSNNLSTFSYVQWKRFNAPLDMKNWTFMLSLSWFSKRSLTINWPNRVKLSASGFYIIRYNKDNTIALLFLAGLCDTWIWLH